MMKRFQKQVFFGLLPLLLSIIHLPISSAQTFDSGSTGADGAFAPTSNMTLSLPSNGVYHFTTINIPTGVEVTFTRNAANTPVIFLASGNIVIDGTINADGQTGVTIFGGTLHGSGGLGGPGGFDGGCIYSGGSTSFGSGSYGGGAIRIVAESITGTGLIDAQGAVSQGRIRLKAFNVAFSGPITPTPSVVITPGPVSATISPSLSGGLPTLSFSQIGGLTPPPQPGGSLAVADLQLPSGTTNPIPVTLLATNTPVSTTFTVRVLPASGADETFSSILSTGTFANSTTTANINLLAGQVNVIMAFADFVIPEQIASLLPKINGEPVDHILLAANIRQPSTLTLVTKSGKEIPARKILSA